MVVVWKLVCSNMHVILGGKYLKRIQMYMLLVNYDHSNTSISCMTMVLKVRSCCWLKKEKPMMFCSLKVIVKWEKKNTMTSTLTKWIKDE
jgi:hypothetical protein